MTLRQRIHDGFFFLDGAMGTMIQQSGVVCDGPPELLNLTHPELISEIHKQYVQAGSDMVLTCTFGANRLKLAGTGHTPKEIISAAVANAKAAGADFVGLDVGPLGELLEPTGSLHFEEAYELFAEMVDAGTAAGVDCIYIETMTDLYETKAAVLAAKERCGLPVFVTMTFEDNLRTFTGTPVESMALTLTGLGADAIGVNCSLGPDEIMPIAQRLCELTSLPVIAKPNAGLPDLHSDRPSYSIGKADFAQSLARYADFGVTVFGGCCGTTPAYICALRAALEGRVPVKREVPPFSAVCSAGKAVFIDDVTVIGERINPTGKKLFKEALLHEDYGYVLKQGISQVEAGAQILDVNVGLPGLDEAAVMCRVVKELQGILDTPLQLDSSSPEVLRKALRLYNGIPLVNSVNGEEKVLEAVLPLVKQYGACVVGLTLDEHGIPGTVEGRIDIANRIIKRAEQYGIPKERVFIDCLTLTVSAEQDGAVQTLKALRTVREQLQVHTVLGVSNISFGLPNRPLINQSFLTLALANGLTLPILNPNAKNMMDAIDAYRVLYAKDRGAVDYIARQGAAPADRTPAAVPEMTADYAVAHGLKEECARCIEALLHTKEELSIVNEILIPALDEVGRRFETGEIFLPQLIRSAEAAKAGFDVINQSLSSKGTAQEKPEAIVVATVKGDIHDIGKNIVKVILVNYGYRVIDLGRDVPAETVLEACKKYHPKLVGLSALMTTTLKSMEETIRLLKKEKIDCKIFVGGAVLTEDYAMQMGADFYARDAKASVDIAKRIIG